MLVRVSSKRFMENVANKREVSVNENEYALLGLLSQRSTLTKSEVVEFVWGACPNFCVNGFQVKAGRCARRTRW